MKYYLFRILALAGCTTMQQSLQVYSEADSTPGVQVSPDRTLEDVSSLMVPKITPAWVPR